MTFMYYIAHKNLQKYQSFQVNQLCEFYVV